MYYVYILYSNEMDRYYIGSTADVEARLTKHLEHHKGFTSKAKDWVVVYTELLDSKSQALKREKQIKGWKSRAMINKLIDQSS